MIREHRAAGAGDPALQLRLEAGGDFLLVAGVDGELAEGGAFGFVVFVELEADRRGSVGRFPAPFSDRDELERHAFVPAQPGTVSANEKAIADADVSGGDETRGAVGREHAFDGVAGGEGRIVVGSGGRSGRKIVEREIEGRGGIRFGFARRAFAGWTVDGRGDRCGKRGGGGCFDGRRFRGGGGSRGRFGGEWMIAARSDGFDGGDGIRRDGTRFFGRSREGFGGDGRGRLSRLVGGWLGRGRFGWRGGRLFRGS